MPSLNPLVTRLAQAIAARLDAYPPHRNSIAEIDLGHRMGILDALRILYQEAEGENWKGDEQGLIAWAKNTQ